MEDYVEHKAKCEPGPQTSHSGIQYWVKAWFGSMSFRHCLATRSARTTLEGVTPPTTSQPSLLPPLAGPDDSPAGQTFKAKGWTEAGR